MSGQEYTWETEEEKQAIIAELMKRYDDPPQLSEEELADLDPENVWYGQKVYGDKSTYN